MRSTAPVLVALLVAFSSGCATAPGPSAATVEAELQRLESAKWDPPSLGTPEAFMALFADDFVSVEYGSNTQAGVQRKTRAQVFGGGPLPPAKFELSDWRFIHADSRTVILSYHVNALSFPWRAYATSVWANRGGRWTTVFYQASTAD